MTHLVFSLVEQRWIGRSIIVFALIHILLNIIFLQKGSKAVVIHNPFDNITSFSIEVGSFLLFLGLLLFPIGLFIDWAEKNLVPPLPRFLPWLLTALTIFGIIMIPNSSFYLMTPVVIGLFCKQKVDTICYNW